MDFNLSIRNLLSDSWKCLLFNYNEILSPSQPPKNGAVNVSDQPPLGARGPNDINRDTPPQARRKKNDKHMIATGIDLRLSMLWSAMTPPMFDPPRDVTSASTGRIKDKYPLNPPSAKLKIQNGLIELRIN